MMQISEQGLHEIYQRLEETKHIEFKDLEKAIAHKQASSEELNSGNSDILQISGDRAMLKIDGMLMYNPDLFQRFLMNAIDTADYINALQALQANEDIKKVLVVWNSPGGSVQKLHVLADAMKQLADTKPTVSLNVGTMASAAYHAGSQASRVYVDDYMNKTGSIGTMALAKDTSQAAKMAGVEVIPIVTGPLKAMLQPGVEITEEMKEELQKEANQIQSVFNQNVNRVRPQVDLADGSRARSGASFYAEEAQELGLIDGIASISQAFKILDQMEQTQNLGI